MTRLNFTATPIPLRAFRLTLGGHWLKTTPHPLHCHGCHGTGKFTNTHGYVHPCVMVRCRTCGAATVKWPKNPRQHARAKDGDECRIMRRILDAGELAAAATRARTHNPQEASA